MDSQSPDPLRELLERLDQGDYAAGYEAACLLDPNCRGHAEVALAKDAVAALSVYRRTNTLCADRAAAGDPVAQSYLALAYQCGLGCEPDVEQAVYWLERAFEGGQFVVANTLAALLADGHGAALKADKVKARLWYGLAKKHGCHFVYIEEFEQPA